MGLHKGFAKHHLDFMRPRRDSAPKSEAPYVTRPTLPEYRPRDFRDRRFRLQLCPTLVRTGLYRRIADRLAGDCASDETRIPLEGRRPDVTRQGRGFVNMVNPWRGSGWSSWLRTVLSTGILPVPPRRDPESMARRHVFSRRFRRRNCSHRTIFMAAQTPPVVSG